MSDAAEGERRMTTEEAIQHLRADPEYADLIRWSYLGPDTLEASERFGRSAEFERAEALVSGFRDRQVLDLGAGTGIASRAIAEAGASRVIALEPDPSGVIGRGAIARVADREPIEIVDGTGENLPLPDASIDIAYARQVLHHAADLPAVGRELARVLRPGGVFLDCREHVVDDDEELAVFLSEHPVHRLAGGEGAYRLDEYLDAIHENGLRIRRVWGPYDSIINAFPALHSEAELAEFRRRVLGWPLASLGRLGGKLPVTSRLIQERLAPHTGPGRMYSFLAERP
jgi:SAM-dependent methyltransferase